MTTRVNDKVMAIVQGNPGALYALDALGSTFPNEIGAIVDHLYQRGPRGHHLWTYYKARNEDALLTGRDILARVSEFSGWGED